MTHSSHFPQLVPNRVQKAVARLQAMIWRNPVALPVSATESTTEHLTLSAGKKRGLRAIQPGEAWGKLFEQRWCRVELPAAVPKGSFLHWRDEGEATLHVNGRAHFGLDVAHRYAPLPLEVEETWVESYCCQSAIWHPDTTGLSPQGSRFEGAFLVQRDEAAWAAYHDLKCLFDLLCEERLKQIPGAPRVLNGFGLQLTATQLDVFYRRLLRRLDEAVDAFDTRGMAGLRNELKKIYREFADPAPLATAVASGHAHLDLVWLWPEKMGEAKAVHTFATANRLMDDYPEFRFAYSQSASYAAVDRRNPELGKTVRARLKTGQWQATGALYVESDTLLPCGEALARSFVLGQADFSKLNGELSRLLWLPDVFGYAGCLPQLCQLSGVDWFFTTKLTWNAINAFPYSSFVWRGTDGSEVTAHVTQEVGYVNSMQVTEIQNGLRGHQQSDVHREYLLPTGFGDGGGGVTAEMCERARRLSGLRGLPEIKWDQPEAFFARLDQIKPALPVHQGECYLEYHRGTFTTHGRLKAAFRALERALQVAEAVSCATDGEPASLRTWQRLVFAQFHDFIPGSSVPEVYAEGIPELENLAVTTLAETKRKLFGAPNQSCWFNPLPLKRKVVRAGHGRKKASVVEVPPLSGIVIADLPSIASATVFATEHELRTERVRALFDRQGWLQALAIDGEKIEIGEHFGALKLFSDVPANFESWDIDQHTLALGTVVDEVPTIELERGELAATIVVRRKIGKKSLATVRFSVSAAEPVLRVDLEVNWHEEYSLLKMMFATDYRGRDASCGQPFGSVLRSQLPTSKQAEAMWEMPASRHLTVMDDDKSRGLSVITEAKYGFSVREGTIGVSLIRAPRITGHEEHGLIGYRAPLSQIKPASPFTDQGSHRIRLALAPWRSSLPREEHPAALAETLFSDLIPYEGASCQTALIGIDGGNSLVPSWAKPEGKDRWVLRLHETTGARGTVTLHLARGWTAQPVDLLGRQRGSKASRFDFLPHQILSLRLTRAKR